MRKVQKFKFVAADFLAGFFAWVIFYLLRKLILEEDSVAFTVKLLGNAGAPVIPKSLLSQLSVGGALVIPVGDEQSQKMVRVVRETTDEFTREVFQNFKFVPLLGKSGWNK